MFRFTAILPFRSFCPQSHRAVIAVRRPTSMIVPSCKSLRYLSYYQIVYVAVPETIADKEVVTQMY